MNRHNNPINKIFRSTFYLSFSGFCSSVSYHLLCAFLPIPVMVSHVHQFVLQFLDGPHLSALPFPAYLNGWLAHNRATLYTSG